MTWIEGRPFFACLCFILCAFDDDLWPCVCSYTSRGSRLEPEAVALLTHCLLLFFWSHGWTINEWGAFSHHPVEKNQNIKWGLFLFFASWWQCWGTYFAVSPFFWDDFFSASLLQEVRLKWFLPCGGTKLEAKKKKKMCQKLLLAHQMEQFLRDSLEGFFFRDEDFSSEGDWLVFHMAVRFCIHGGTASSSDLLLSINLRFNWAVWRRHAADPWPTRAIVAVLESLRLAENMFSQSCDIRGDFRLKSSQCLCCWLRLWWCKAAERWSDQPCEGPLSSPAADLSLS